MYPLPPGTFSNVSIPQFTRQPLTTKNYLVLHDKRAAIEKL